MEFQLLLVLQNHPPYPPPVPTSLYILVFFTEIVHDKESLQSMVYYILDVLCCQQIKLFQVVSTSEFHEY